MNATGETATTAGAVHPEVMVVVATGRDAAGWAPMAAEVGVRSGVHTLVVATGMASILVDDMLGAAGVPAAVTLLVDRPARSAADELALLLTRLDRLVEERRPDAVLVHGGSLAALAAAQAAFWRGIPVIHLEAPDSAPPGPFPESATRTLLSRIATVSLRSPDAATVGEALARISSAAPDGPGRQAVPVPTGAAIA